MFQPLSLWLILTCDHSRKRPEKLAGFDRGPGFAKGGVNNFVEDLVSQGIITQEQADKWQAFDESKVDERKAEMDKVKAMTAEERKAYFDEKKDTKADPLSELVSAGIIT